MWKRGARPGGTFTRPTQWRSGVINDSDAHQMLDLFRSDAEGQLQVLSAGLLALKRRTSASERLDPCVCAANSLKDAADMIGLPLGTSIAGALEDCFIALQRRRFTARPETLEVMTRGVDLFARIARTPDVQASSWGGTQHPQVDAFLAEAQRLCQGQEPVASGVREVIPAATPMTAPVPRILPAAMTRSLSANDAGAPVTTAARPVAVVLPAPVPVPVAIPVPVAVPVPIPVSVATPAPVPTSPASPSVAADPAAVFRREADKAADALTAGLFKLQANPAATSPLESCARAARTLLHAAQDADFRAGVRLARALEDCFVDAQRGRFRLRPSSIELLQRGVEMLARLFAAPASAEENPELRLFLAAVKCVLESAEELAATAAKPTLRAPEPAPVLVQPPPAPDAEPATEIVQLKTMAELMAAAEPDDAEPATEIVQLSTMAELRALADPAPLDPLEPMAPQNAGGSAFAARLEADSGATMLELFQIEAERLLQEFAEALSALQRNPAAPELLEPCMRACQSLKGATRMIGLPVGVSLSHALLECFIAAQEGRITLHQSGIGLLLQSADLLASIARKPEAEFGRWGGELGSEIEVFIAALKRLRDGTDEIDAAGAAAASAQVFADLVPVPAPALADADRLTLLELFHGEGKNLSQTLTKGLLALQLDPLAPDHLESCMRAAHSFKGASRIVGLSMGVNLSRALEDCFVAAQHGRITLRQSAINVLLRGADLLGRMARTVEADFGQWSDKRRAEVELIVAGLQRVRGSTAQPSASEQLQARMRASMGRAR